MARLTRYDWCCHGWRWPSLVCLADDVLRCHVPAVCRLHDRLITGDADAEAS